MAKSSGLKKGLSKRALLILRYIFLCLLTLVVLLPIAYLIMQCFKTFDEIYDPNVIFPRSNNLINNVREVVTSPEFMFFRHFGNTMLIFLLKIAGVLPSCGLAAYGFYRFKCRLANWVFFALVAIMFLPGELLGIPFYEMMVRLNVQYSPIYLPMWLGAWFGIDITAIFLFKQYFESTPSSLIDAAKIDGCGEFKAFFKVVLPLAKPVIVSLIILYFTGTYNDVYSPALYIRADNEEGRVIAQSISTFLNKYNTGGGDFLVPWELVSVATVITILPVLGFFFIAQKNFVESLTGTAVKG